MFIRQRYESALLIRISDAGLDFVDCVDESCPNLNRSIYESCSFSIYKKRAAIEIAGKTNPTSGTKIEGRYRLIKRSLDGIITIRI